MTRGLAAAPRILGRHTRGTVRVSARYDRPYPAVCSPSNYEDFRIPDVEAMRVACPPVTAPTVSGLEGIGGTTFATSKDEPSTSREAGGCALSADRTGRPAAVGIGHTLHSDPATLGPSCKRLDGALWARPSK